MNSMVRQMSLYLPKWPDAFRGGPNVLLRSALFAGIHSSKRQFIGIQTSPEKEPEGVTIASQDGQSIKYAGTQLNQYDADVFFELMHRSRREALGNAVFFTGADFLASIGRTRNDLNYEDLDDSLRRLNRGTLDVFWQVGAKRYTFVGSLVGNYIREDESKLYRVSLSPEIKTLFSPASYTQLEWEERLKLKGKPLALWLHSYFSTHAKPFPVSASYLKEKTGSPTKLVKHFKPELRTALKALESLDGWTVEWNGDNITVTHPETGSQVRHTDRKDNQRKALKAAKQQDLAPKQPNPQRTSPQQPRPQQQPKGLTSMQEAFGGLFN
jgi:TrfA protein